MKRRGLATRSALFASAVAAFVAVGAITIAASPTRAVAQQRPKDLNAIPPVPTTYVPKKTAWGDPDFRGTWPIENLDTAHILFQRPKQYGMRQWVTPRSSSAAWTPPSARTPATRSRAPA